jgi:hypothetical protein
MQKIGLKTLDIRKLAWKTLDFRKLTWKPDISESWPKSLDSESSPEKLRFQKVGLETLDTESWPVGIGFRNLSWKPYISSSFAENLR